MWTDSLLEQIQNELQDLPGKSAHIEMFPLRETSRMSIPDKGEYKVSATMAMLFPEEEEIKLTLTQRHDYKGKHGGQISFPGGKTEEFDESTIQTALRETQEEIGINPNQINVLGKLTDVYIPVSNFLVHPYVGYHDSSPKFIASDKEVKEIITFNVTDLLKEENRQTTKIKTSNGLYLKDIPCFTIHDKIVWGATALMLNELKIILNRVY
jgi:8-oxo-dGTP pyrophosphatase MutT (NUDIX family)